MNTEQQSPFSELLAERGLTSIDVAAAIGTNESTVSRWRNRRTPPRAEFRKLIIRKLKLTDEELKKLDWPEGHKESAGV